MRPARWARVAAFVVIGAVVARPARTQGVPELAAAGRLLEQGRAAAAGGTIRAAYAASPKKSGAAAVRPNPQLAPAQHAPTKLGG